MFQSALRKTEMSFSYTLYTCTVDVITISMDDTFKSGQQIGSKDVDYWKDTLKCQIVSGFNVEGTCTEDVLSVFSFWFPH